MECVDNGVDTAVIHWNKGIPPTPAEVCGVKEAEACISCSTVGAVALCELYAKKPAFIEDRFLGHEVKHPFGCNHVK